MNNSSDSTNALAAALLEVVPVVMRAIRAQMRANQDAELSVPQFRILSYVHRRGSVSLSSVAEHMGITLPSTSKMVDGLVVRGLVDRRTDSSDRRKVAIEVTREGEGVWTAARKATLDLFARRLERLPGPKREALLHALETLRGLFFEESSRPAATGEGDGNP